MLYIIKDHSELPVKYNPEDIIIDTTWSEGNEKDSRFYYFPENNELNYVISYKGRNILICNNIYYELKELRKNEGKSISWITRIVRKYTRIDYYISKYLLPDDYKNGALGIINKIYNSPQNLRYKEYIIDAWEKPIYEFFSFTGWDKCYLKEKWKGFETLFDITEKYNPEFSKPRVIPTYFSKKKISIYKNNHDALLVRITKKYAAIIEVKNGNSFKVTYFLSKQQGIEMYDYDKRTIENVKKGIYVVEITGGDELRKVIEKIKRYRGK